MTSALPSATPLSEEEEEARRRSSLVAFPEVKAEMSARRRVGLEDMKKRTHTVAMAAPRTKETSGLMLLTSPPFILAVAGWFWSTTASWVSGPIDPPLELSLLYRRRGGDGAGAERGGGGGPSNKQRGWLLLIRKWGEREGLRPGSRLDHHKDWRPESNQTETNVAARRRAGVLVIVILINNY